MASNDFVISTNLVVFGMSTFTGGQTFDGQAIIDIDSAEALLVREDGDTGDVFIVNTNTPSATLPHVNSFISLGPNPSATGDIRFGNTRFIAWRNMNNNGDVQALSVDEDDFLNIGSAAALRSRILSPRLDMLSGADLLWPAEDGDIGASGATRPANVHVKSTVVIGDDETGGYGITIGDNHQGHSPLWIVGSFTSDGAQGFSAASAWNMILTGFAGDTVLAGLHVNNQITTQGNTDVIANVASLFLAEPQIIVGTGDTITNAQTLLIVGEPTEGVNNYALRITAGHILLPGPDNDAGTPTLAFGDGDTGFYEQGDDSLQLSIGAGARVRWNTTSMRSLTSGSWQLDYAVASATDPPFTFQGDTNIGMGRAAADQLSLISGGAEIVRIAGTGADFVQVRHQGNFTSDGSSTLATKFLFDGGLIGAPGDTASLFGADFNATITTQTATESITDIAQVRIDEPSIADNLTGLITHASILLLTSSTVLNEGVNNWGIRALGAAPSVFQAAQFIIGRTTVDDWLGVIIGGQFTSGGGNTLAARVRTEGGMTGAPGDTSLLTGMWLDVSVATQIASETIGSISQIRIDEPAIADNLTGGGLITNAQTLEITGSPTEGVNNFSLRSLGAAPSLFAGLQFVIGTTVVLDRIQFQLAGSFTSGGSGVNSQSFALTSTLIGASGDTGSLASAFFDGNITTQTATENIADVSQVRIEEPNITDNLTGDVTTAHTLFLVGSPTEGVSNFVLRATGAAPTMFQGLQFVIGDFNVDDFDQVHIGGTFTSGGASTTASKFVLDGTIIGASGDTVSLNGALLAARITTQTETENISDISGVHIVQPNITDNLTGNIDRAHTLLLNGSPTQGVANFVLRANGAAPTMFQGLQFVIGDFAVDDFWQVNISGAFISGGTSTEAAKLRIEGSVTGADGDTAGLVGAYFDATFVTQTAVENIANISQCRFDGAVITDNLTGDITNAQTLFITASPTAGEANWTIRSTALAPSIFQGQQFAIGATSIFNYQQFTIAGGFTSGGGSAQADKLRIMDSLTGAAGDAVLNGAFFAASITTQTAAEVLTDVAQVRISEPAITLGAGSSITNAQTLLIVGAPSEGVNNYAIRVTSGDVILGGNLIVSGAGPHAIAGTPSGIIGLIISETFTSDGSGTLASGVFVSQTLVGASGDTTSLTGTTFISAITTQTETETIANISQVEINEPFITDNLTGDITNAQTLLIVNAPTEGVNNYAIRVITGNVFFGGAQAIFGDGTAALPGIRFESDTDTGFYLNAGNDSLLVSVNANSIIRWDRASSIPRMSLSSDCQLAWLSGSAEAGGTQFVLLRESPDAGGAAVGDLALTDRVNFSMYEERTSTTDYHRTSIRTVTETLSSVTGASVATASIIPAGALVLGVTTDVDVALGVTGGTTGYNVGDGTDVDRWGAITGTSVSTFSDDADFTTTTIDRFSAAGAVTITAVGGNFDGTGDIVVVVHYLEIGARKP